VDWNDDYPDDFPTEDQYMTDQTPDRTAPPTTTHTDMTRRSFGLATTGLLATAAGATTLSAQTTHDHGASHDAGGTHQGAAHKALVEAALHCVNKGEVCLNHCVTQMGSGDTSLKDCLATVAVMLPMCTTLARVAAMDAKRLKDIAAVCIDICRDCEEECRKHEQHHAECKACAESCAACIAECKKVTDA
jgi:Cys-rich four helix bundle protein (predicted Tat secretion target)